MVTVGYWGSTVSWCLARLLAALWWCWCISGFVGVVEENHTGWDEKNGEDEKNGCVGYYNCLCWDFYGDADNDSYRGFGLWEKTRFLVLKSKN